MSFVQAKCTSCGSTLSIDNERSTGFCTYCGAQFVTERAVAAIQNTYNTTTNNQGTVIHNYYGTQQRQVTAPPRPRISVILLILGIWLYVLPGIFYFGFVRSRQRKWDEMFGY